MSTPQSERLYNLLPAIYRQRDAVVGETLRALLAIMEQELTRMEADIDTLYENWFIETCEERVIPYIGDLLGIEGLTDGAQKIHSPRARVGNAILHRRHKGPASVLVSVTKELTAWEAVQAVEFFEYVATTQHVQHVRPGKGATFNIRKQEAIKQLGTPSDNASYMADLRRRYNLGKIGLFVSRPQSEPTDSWPAARLREQLAEYLPVGMELEIYYET